MGGGRIGVSPLGPLRTPTQSPHKKIYKTQNPQKNYKIRKKQKNQKIQNPKKIVQK